MRHVAGNWICTSPVVVVWSEYDPSVLAVHVPVTWRDPPVTVEDLQSIPRADMSSVPASVRQVDCTLQVPTTLPPQGVTLVQAGAVPPVLELPPVAELLPPVALPPVALPPVARPPTALPPVDSSPASPADDVPPEDVLPPVVEAVPPVPVLLL